MGLLNYIKILTILFCFFSLFSCTTGETVFSKDETKTLALNNTKSIILINISGNITIKSSQTNQITVRATKKSSVESKLSDVEINYTEGETLFINTNYLNSASSNVSVDYTVQIPSNIVVSLKNTAGDVTIMDIKEIDTIDCQTSSVLVSNSDIIKNIFVTTGTISARITEMKADSYFKTTTGSIKVVLLTADYRKIITESTTGAIYLVSSEYGSGVYDIKAESVSGNLTISYQ